MIGRDGIGFQHSMGANAGCMLKVALVFMGVCIVELVASMLKVA